MVEGFLVIFVIAIGGLLIADVSNWTQIQDLRKRITELEKHER